jgi:hypothetical protein
MNVPCVLLEGSSCLIVVYTLEPSKESKGGGLTTEICAKHGTRKVKPAYKECPMKIALQSRNHYIFVA